MLCPLWVMSKGVPVPPSSAASGGPFKLQVGLEGMLTVAQAAGFVLEASARALLGILALPPHDGHCSWE